MAEDGPALPGGRARIGVKVRRAKRKAAIRERADYSRAAMYPWCKWLCLASGGAFSQCCFGLQSAGCAADHDAPSPIDAGSHEAGEVLADAAEDGDRFHVFPDSPIATSCAWSRECYAFPDDCCAVDCASVRLVPMNGIERRDYFHSCSARGCVACRVSAEWIPRCVENRCTFVDLGSSAFSACKVDDDCELRWGTNCCDLCHPNPATDLVSVARSATFCEDDNGGCDPCTLVPFPSGARPICQDGHCRVQR